MLTNAAMTVENVFKHELAPVPTSIFNDDGDLRPEKSKADMKRTLESKVSTRTMNKPELTIIDGSAISWVVNWPTKASVVDYLQSFSSYILPKLATGNINLAFDRYYDYSIKSSTRSGRGRSTCRTHKLTPTSPLPSKITTLGSSENTSQLIELICDHLLFTSDAVFINNGSSMIHRQVQNALIIEGTGLSTTHEEADVTIVQQAYQLILDVGIKSICVICDDTDAFVLLVFFYQKLGVQANVFLQATSDEGNIADKGVTVKANKEIIPSILAAHAASGCDTVPPYHGVGKASIVKKLRTGEELKLLGNTATCIDGVVNETATLISSCYGFETKNMADCRINPWYQKTSKAIKPAPLIPTLPPTHEASRENVNRAHCQVATWYSTMNPHPPNLDPTLWMGA